MEKTEEEKDRKREGEKDQDTWRSQKVIDAKINNIWETLKVGFDKMKRLFFSSKLITFSTNTLRMF